MTKFYFKLLTAVLLLLSYNSMAQISGVVFNDFSWNGIKDPGESGISGISVSAYNNAGVQIGLTVLTDVNGDYTIATATGYTRVEFSGYSASWYSTVNGTSSNTSVQFAIAPAININFGLAAITPAVQDTAMVFAPYFVVGPYNQLVDTNNFKITEAVTKFKYGQTGFPVFDNTKIARFEQVGATYGTAYKNIGDKLFLSAFMKRGSGFGPAGTGGIYRLNPAVGEPSVLHYATIPNSGVDPHDFSGNFLMLNYDSVSNDKAGRLSLGDMELSSTGDSLFVINMNDKHLYYVDPNATSGFPINGVDLGLITPPAGCIASEFRPFGLGIDVDGVLYIGAVCSYESSLSTDSLSIYVIKYQTNTFTTVFSRKLNYTVSASPIFNWTQWSVPVGDVTTGISEPTVSDIQFIGKDMVLGMRNRRGDLYYDPAFNGSFAVLGDLLRVCWNGASWNLENAKVCGSRTGTGNIYGPGGGEFYFDDDRLAAPQQSMGSLAWRQGGHLVNTHADPFVAIENGVFYSNNENGAHEGNLTGGIPTGHRIYQGIAAGGRFGKTAGLGDIEMLAGPILEIGNRVWNDANGDGIQNANEPGIDGVVVTLYRGGNLILTDTTSNGGQYYFSDLSDNNPDVELYQNTAYQVRIENVALQPSLSGFNLSLKDADLGVNGDLRDNDAAAVGPDIIISLTTGSYGENNHSYDFGFIPDPVYCQVYVSDYALNGVPTNDAIRKFDQGNGSLLATLSPLNGPNGSVWDIDNYNEVLYVGSRDQGGFIRKYSLGGAYLGNLVNNAQAYAAFNANPAGTLVDAPAFDFDAFGKVYIATGNSSIARFDTTGANGVNFIHIGFGMRGVYVDRSNGDVYIMHDIGSGLGGPGGIARYSSAGVLLDRNDLSTNFPIWSPGSGFGMDKRNNKLYIVHDNGGWDQKGVLEVNYNKIGGGNTYTSILNTDFKMFAQAGNMGDPRDLEFGPDGNLYVANHAGGNSQIFKFDGTAGGNTELLAFPSVPNNMQFKGIAFGCSTSCSNPNAGYDQTSIPGGVINLLGAPSTGTWTALPNNPAGATLTPGVSGASSVTFGPAASGNYYFIYTEGACYDTMKVTMSCGIPNSPLGATWVKIGNPGNPADGPLYGHNGAQQIGRGSIPYEFYVSDQFITYGELVTYLNAADPFNTKNLAGGPLSGGMISNGAGVWTVNTLSNCFQNLSALEMAGMSVHFLSLNNEAHYANWRSTGNIDAGAYTFVTPQDGNANIASFNNAYVGYRILTKDECYKATFWNPNTNAYDLYGATNLNGLGAPLVSDLNPNGTYTNPNGYYYLSNKCDYLEKYPNQGGKNSYGLYQMCGGFHNTTLPDAGPFPNTNVFFIPGNEFAGVYDMSSDFNGLYTNSATNYFASPSFRLSYYGNPCGSAKACLGNYVWNDINQNGIQNVGEVGVSGVTVSLLNGLNESIISTVSTDAYGFYQFCNLDAGDYKVQFSLPVNYIFTGQNAPNDSTDSDPNVFTGITDLYTLAPGDSNMTIDAGIFQPLPITATVGDRVWFDINENGTQDPGESGISGVTVSLYNCANPTVPVATTITDANGNYLFENVAGGSYQVGFTLPIGMVFTTQTGAVVVTDNSDANSLTGKTACFPVIGGDHLTYVDAGLKLQPIITASLGDRVWNDANQNGIQDPGETGVQGVTVTLYDATGVTVISTTETNSLGNYGFNGIPAGCYVVGFSLPVGYTRTTQDVGADTTKDSDVSVMTGLTNQICIAAGQNNPTIDAGIYNAASTNSIGDKVWYDVDRDGIQDMGEYGYPGVVVTLYDCATNAILATTTTDALGNYLFGGVTNGSYYVGFGFIAGYQFTGANTDVAGILGQNNSDANPSNGLTDCVTLIGNTNITSVDAGIFPGDDRNATSSLGDIVWTDANNNGLQDNGETGVPGVKVTLFEADGVTVIDTILTDGLGNYIFTNLDGGNFVVGFSNLPAGYTFTTPSGNIEDETNSDANIVTGKTGVIALGLGEDKMSVDAGIIAPIGTVCLGDYVWIDLNNNGTQDAIEPAVPGVTVKLYDNNTNTVLQTATTNSEGKYLFCGLTNGNTYSVGFENLPAGFTFTTQIGALNVADNSDANPLTGRTTTVTLGALNDLTLDAGIFSSTTAVVGNYVWYDEDADGIQDPNEAPIAGVLVTLYDNTNTAVASAVTNANGGYLFTNVAPGTYTIGFEGYPITLVPTTKGANALDDDDSNIDSVTGRTDAFTVTAGSSNLTIDAGYKANPIAGLGNFVWFDINENGLQDASESSISGVVVTLYEADGVTVKATAITDGNGAYSFPNLVAGSYVVGFGNLPVGYTRTQIVGVLNDPLNSDVNSNNKTNTITLLAGTYNPNIDAGYYLGVPLPTKALQATLATIGSNDACEINWYTRDEMNTKHFEIERSIDGKSFSQVGTKLAGVNTIGQTDYAHVDDITPINNESLIYYRIKLVDIDQNYLYSNVITARKGQNDNILVYPTLFSDVITIEYTASDNSSLDIIVTDGAGRTLMNQNYEVEKGFNKLKVDKLENVSSGNYFIKVVNQDFGEKYILKLQKK